MKSLQRLSVESNVFKPLRTQYSLESFINDKIRTIPPHSNDFMLKTHIIDYDEKKVCLIEVKKENSYCVYYSGVTENAYKRKNHESIALTLTEILEIIANNNYPQIYVSLNNVKAQIHKNKGSTLRFALKYENKGPSPTEDCNILVFICSNDDTHIQHGLSRLLLTPIQLI